MMNRLYNGQGKTLFQSLEQGAIKETILGGASMYTGRLDVSARLFPLSSGEARTIGWGSDLLKARSINAPEGSAGWWWLRSSFDSDGAYCVYEDGFGNIDDLGDDLGVRPAFHLNLNSILFTSAAENGKDGSLGTLSAVGDYTGREWKLTLHDSERDGFEVIEKTAEMAPGDTVTLNYTGATVKTDEAPNEYISAILTDKDGNLLRYGRLTQPTTAESKVDVKIPADLTDGTYTLKVFSEQYNGDYKTDYAGEFDEVTLTVANVTKYDVWVGGTQVDETNLNDILNDGGKAKYDPDTGTLTLNNPTITTVHPDESAVIFCEEDGPFTVTGTAALNVSGAEYGLRYQGEGDLTVNGDISATGVNGGISAPHANINIADGTVEATATFAASPDNSGGCTALYTEGKLIVTGGALTANAIGGGWNIGIYAQGGVEISGGELTAQGNQCGISVGESADITFANGTKAVWAMGYGSAVTMGNGVISIGDLLELRLPDNSGYHSIAGVKLSDDKNEVLDGSGRTAKVVNILPVGFTVIFDPNGGSVTPTSGTTDADGKLTSLPTPTRSGSYRFDGWYTEKTGGTKVDENTAFSANDTIYAHWAYTGGGSGGGSATTKYTLTYNTNGGNSITATKHNKNATVNLTATPIREGYDFTGWYADKELKNAVTSVKMDGDKTVYAGWKAAVPAEETPLLVVTINSMKYLLNGKTMMMDSAPFIDGNNRTMLPVRVIANALGITNDNIKWDSATKTAYFTREDGKVVSCTVNSNVIQIGDEKVTIDTVPVIRNGRIYLPMRALFNVFDVPDENILWDAVARTVTVTKKD
ncbi:MAG: InlB B-repeat-containing protein [Anaerotignum sp.]|nr:InlB B-repeat-containing protein [Anaerotignum sp.]